MLVLAAGVSDGHFRGGRIQREDGDSAINARFIVGVSYTGIRKAGVVDD
jgi:hypothetical protein